MAFAPLPPYYDELNRKMMEAHPDTVKVVEPIRENKYDQIDDFNWLKQSPSPNFRVMGADEVIREEVWRDVVPGSEKVGLTDVLKAVGVKGAERRRSRRGSESCGEGF